VAPEPGGLLIVAGHAIYQDGGWHGGYPGDEQTYQLHLTRGVKLCRTRGYDALVLSGGRTRDRAPGFPAERIQNSEAAGLAQLVDDLHLHRRDAPPILQEPLARDSFENLLFSMLCYHRQLGRWPARVGLVSWKFKALRCYMIACGLGLDGERFTFHGCGDLTGRATEGAAVTSVAADAAMVERDEQGRPTLHDPMQRAARPFASKRAERMPWRFDSNAAYLRQVKATYDPDPAGGEVSRLLDTVEALGPGQVWREVQWPWNP
jgi:hypothetical protein